MNKSTYIVSLFVAGFIGVVLGYSLTHQPVLTQTASPSGTTNSTAKLYSVSGFAPATGSATSTSILNDSSTDRAIIEPVLFCSGVGTSKTAYTGAGLASLLFRFGTTSTAISGSLADSNTNYAGQLTLATSSTDSFVASTTEGVIFGTSRVWPAGSYLTIQPNATNTATCTAGVWAIQL